MIIENKKMGIRFVVKNNEDFKKWITEYVKQIRADAIDECINELIEEHEYFINRGENDSAFGVRLCIEDLFQLKEQK